VLAWWVIVDLYDPTGDAHEEVDRWDVDRRNLRDARWMCSADAGGTASFSTTPGIQGMCTRTEGLCASAARCLPAPHCCTLVSGALSAPSGDACRAASPEALFGSMSACPLGAAETLRMIRISIPTFGLGSPRCRRVLDLYMASPWRSHAGLLSTTFRLDDDKLTAL